MLYYVWLNGANIELNWNVLIWNDLKWINIYVSVDAIQVHPKNLEPKIPSPLYPPWFHPSVVRLPDMVMPNHRRQKSFLFSFGDKASNSLSPRGIRVGLFLYIYMAGTTSSTVCPKKILIKFISCFTEVHILDICLEVFFRWFFMNVNKHERLNLFMERWIYYSKR